MSKRTVSQTPNGVAASFEDLLQCMICFEPYCSPKMLQCGHTFCEECLQGYHNTYQHQRRAQPGKLPCPTCRELTAIPDNGIAGLRNDFKVHKIEEMFKTMNIRNRAMSKMCDTCRSQKKAVIAKVYCNKCKLNYCESCLRKHEKNALFKGHTVVDKSVQQKASSSDLTCKVHKGESGAYFCQTCETIVCTLCIMSDHAEHVVTEIDVMCVQQQEDIRNLQQIIDGKVEHLRSRKTEVDSLRKLNLNSCIQAEIGIKEKAELLVSRVRKQEVELLRELREKRDQKLERLMKETETVNFYIAKAHSLQDFARTTHKRNRIQLMAVHDELIKRMRTVVEADASTSLGDLSSVVSFLTGHQDPNIGRVEAVEGGIEQLNRSPLVFSPGVARQTSVPSPERALLHVVTKPILLFHVSKLGSSVGELRDPLGVACLLSGDICVAEWGNKRLQIFDSVGKSVCVIGEGRVEPQDVAVSLRGNIIATDASHKRLEVFSPSGKSIAKWGLGKFFHPCGVSMSPNGNCIVTDVAEHSVNIYQGEKKCLKRIGTRGTQSDQFNNPLYATVGQHNQIIVSDSDNHCVKILSSSGRFLGKFGSQGSGDGQLSFPRGICTDMDGNVIVADRNNHRVSIFSSKGRFIRHLLTKSDGIKDPYGVAFTMTRNLVLTESSANSAALKMYQL